MGVKLWDVWIKNNQKKPHLLEVVGTLTQAGTVSQVVVVTQDPRLIL